MARLGHKKSRLGCRQCKARHVKCDELKPCSNCARHGVQCSLVTWDATSAPPNPPATRSSPAPKRERPAQNTPEQPVSAPFDTEVGADKQSQESATPNTDHNVSTDSPKTEGSSPSSQSDHFPFLSRFIHKSETSQANLWIRDIELIHHWTVEALSTLSHREDIHLMWRVAGPKQALIHTFLMHQMLAFSAFHKTHQNPNQAQEYYTLGVHHQDHAIKGIRQQLQNITPYNSPPIVASSLLLTLNVFASTGFEATMPGAPDAIDAISNIFSLMQGMGNLLAVAYLHVVDSFVAPIFETPTEPTPSQPMLGELARHLPPLIAFIQNKPDITEERRAEYLRTIAHLDYSIKLAEPPPVDNREMRFLFMWPLHLEPSFLDDIKHRRPGALVVLMYYATLMYAAEPLYWFMDGWGNRLLKACFSQIDESWMPAMRWPGFFLNLDPTFDPYPIKAHTPGSADDDHGLPPFTLSHRSAPIHALPLKFKTPHILTPTSPAQQPEASTTSGLPYPHNHVGPPP